MDTEKTKDTNTKKCGCREDFDDKQDTVSGKEVEEDVKIINPDESSMDSRG